MSLKSSKESMEYEDLHNKVKANRFSAILVLKTGDLSFIIGIVIDDSQKYNSQMAVDKKTKVSKRKHFPPVIGYSF